METSTPAVPTPRTALGAPSTTPTPVAVPVAASGQARRRDPDQAHERLLRRGLAVAALTGIALVHLLDLPGKLSETPYLGAGYVVLIVSALALVELLVRRDSTVVWACAGGLAMATMAGYVVNRTVGMPGAMDDIGNWFEPLGMASLFAEAILVLVTSAALVRRPRAH